MHKLPSEGRFKIGAVKPQKNKKDPPNKGHSSMIMPDMSKGPYSEVSLCWLMLFLPKLQKMYIYPYFRGLIDLLSLFYLNFFRQ